MTKLNSAIDLVTALGGGKKIGKEFIVKCPGHEDSTPSLYISDGDRGIVFYCQSNCSQKHLLEVFKERGLEFQFTGKTGIPDLPSGIPYAWPPRSVLKKQGLAPTDENQKRFVKGWQYKDAEGRVIGYVVRYEGHGKKDTIPFFRTFPNGGWCSGHSSKTSRPLYGRHLLAQFPTALVLVVEGEKCANSVNKLNPGETGIVAVSWPGGAKVVKKADWQPLNGREVIIWPDWDFVGLKAAVDVRSSVEAWIGVCDPQKISIEPPSEGWDVADYLEAGGFLTKSILMASLVDKLEPSDHFEPPKRNKSEATEGSEAESEEPAKKTNTRKVHTALLKCGGYALTDNGNAERFVDRLGENLRFTSESGWLIWSGKNWEIDHKNEVLPMTGFVAHEISVDAGKEFDDVKEWNKAMNFAQSSGNIGKMEAILRIAKSLPPIAQEYNNFDADHWKFNCNTGVVDLRDGSVSEPDRSQLISKLAPVDFDPKAECPIWLKFLRQTLQQPTEEATDDFMDYIRRAVGYSLTGSTREQCAFFLWGNGSNGKSIFVETLNLLVGTYGVTTDTKLVTTNERGDDQSSNAVARLKSIRLVVGSEVPPGSRLNEAKVKEMTGQDKMSARFLYKEFFDFIPQFKIWIRCNEKPIIRGNDHGIWRRIHCIPFTNFISEAEKDKELSSKIAKELPAILAWAISGAVDWYRDGLKMAPVVAEATNSYKAEMDVLGDFLEDCCEVEEGAESLASHLYGSYTEWAKGQNEKPATQRRLSLALLKRGFKRTRRINGRFYQGLRLKMEISPSSGSSSIFSDPEDLPF